MLRQTDKPLEIRLGIIKTACRVLTKLLSSNTTYLLREVACDRYHNQIESHEQAQNAYNEYKIASNDNKDTVFEDFLRVTKGQELYNYKLITFNTAPLSGCVNEFDFICYLSATWDEHLLKVFLRNPSLILRKDLSFCYREETVISGAKHRITKLDAIFNNEIDNFLLFLHSENFQEGVVKCLSSDTNTLKDVLEAKRKENKISKAKTQQLLECFNKDTEEISVIRRQILDSKEISSIDVFSYLLNLTFCRGKVEHVAIKSYLPISNPLIPNPTRALLDDFVNISYPGLNANLSEIIDAELNVKIKPLIITCFYVKNNTKKGDMPAGMSEKYIILFALANLIFNINLKEGLENNFEVSQSKVMNLVNCYSESKL